MNDVLVRPARPDEYATVGALTVAAYQQDGHFASESAQPYVAKLADARARAAESELLVAVDADGAVLGTVTVAIPGTPLAQLAGPDEVEFRMLAVRPDVQRRGVGDALVRAVLARAAEFGAAAIVLSSSTWMTAAHRLYLRLGFRRCPDRDWSPGSGVHLVVFRLALN